MRVYVYQAALLCEACGNARREHAKVTVPFYREEDSDYFPQGPYENGGGEADSPQHCDHCHVFLENPLTGDGYAYVREQVSKSDAVRIPLTSIVREWCEFYDIDLDSGARSQVRRTDQGSDIALVRQSGRIGQAY